MIYSRYPPTLLLSCLEDDDDCAHIFCNSVLTLLTTTDTLLSRLTFEDDFDLLLVLCNDSDNLFCCRCSDSSSISLIAWADLEEGEIRLCSALILEPPPPPNQSINERIDTTCLYLLTVITTRLLLYHIDILPDGKSVSSK